MKNLVKIVLAALFFIVFSMNVLAQKIENVKTTGIKAGINFPVGTWSSDYSTGFNVADLTKWNITKNVRILGRMEVTFFGGTEVTQTVTYYGHSYTNTYQTNPFGILTAGSGVELSFIGNGGPYAILDFPSMNIIVGKLTDVRVGFGAGFGFEFSIGKALLGLEVRGNLYNAFLTQKAEQSIAGVQLGFEAAY